MREIITYIAYDDKEFNTREACEKYEREAYDMAKALYTLYDFYNQNGEPIEISTYNIETLLSDLDYAFQSCTTVRVFGKVPENVYEFLYNYYGWDLPVEAGYYKYDFYGEFGGGWIRQD